jgi:hypothetical protein
MRALADRPRYANARSASESIGLRIRGSGVRISPSAPPLRPENKGLLAVRLRSFSKIPCCVAYFINPFNFSLSRLVPISPRNTDATRRFVFRSQMAALGEPSATLFVLPNSPANPGHGLYRDAHLRGSLRSMEAAEAGFLVRLVRSNGIRRVLCGRAAGVTGASPLIVRMMPISAAGVFLR